MESMLGRGPKDLSSKPSLAHTLSLILGNVIKLFSHPREKLTRESGNSEE